MTRRTTRLATFLALVILMVSSMASAQMMPPQKEHEFLEKLVGDWNVTLFVMGEEIEGKEHNELIAGGLWLTSEFSANMMGQPFQGHGILGYDTKKKKYVSVWVDPSRTDLIIMEATMKGTTRSGTTMMIGMTGEKVETKVVETMPDDNHRLLRFLQKGPDGKEMQLMKIEYKRAK